MAEYLAAMVVRAGYLGPQALVDCRAVGLGSENKTKTKNEKKVEFQEFPPYLGSRRGTSPQYLTTRVKKFSAFSVLKTAICESFSSSIRG